MILLDTNVLIYASTGKPFASRATQTEAAGGWASYLHLPNAPALKMLSTSCGVNARLKMSSSSRSTANHPTAFVRSTEQ